MAFLMGLGLTGLVGSSTDPHTSAFMSLPLIRSEDTSPRVLAICWALRGSVSL
jgi:hypothetical protein